MELSDQILALIIRHLSKQSSDADKAALEAWLNENEQHQSEYDKVVRLWESSAAPLSQRIDVEAQWKQFRQKHFSASNLEVAHSRKQSYLKLWRYAAAVVLLIGLGVSAIWATGSSHYKTGEGERLLVTLTDGSEITLSHNSSLRVPHRFNWFDRSLSLDGEALFKVAKNPGKPFEAHGPKTTTRVLGTAFRLIARTDQNRIDLSEGKVAFWAHGNADTLLLTPGQAAQLTNKTLSKIVASEENIDSWLTGVFTFKNTPVQVVLAQLQDHYAFSLAPEYKSLKLDCRFSGSFEKQSQEEVLQELALAMGMDYSWDENTLHINQINCP